MAAEFFGRTQQVDQGRGEQLVRLLSDFWPYGEVAQAYGVFNEKAGLANRGTFLIDTAGVIRYAEVNAPGEPRDQEAWEKAVTTLA